MAVSDPGRDYRGGFIGIVHRVAAGATRLIFEQMLFSEQISIRCEALRNYPQAFTHLSPISAAVNLDRALSGVAWRQVLLRARPIANRSQVNNLPYIGDMVAIIGGGIIGLSIAWRLAQRGVAVHVIDHGRRGGEASPAGAGMLAPGGEFAGRSVWTALGIESLQLYPSYVEELSGESGCPIDFRICGGLELAFNAADWTALRQRARSQEANGISSSETADGIFYPNDGYVDSRHVLAALRSACARRDVRIEEGRTIRDMNADDFDAVVIAAGSWSGELEIRSGNARLDLPKTIPVKGHLLGYDMPPGSLPQIRRHGHSYLLQRANGFTIAGSNEERAGFDTTIDQAMCLDIQKRVAQLWPALAQQSPSERWIGFRPATEDMLPKIGRFEDTNVWLAYGHYRNGILLAPVTAQRITQGLSASWGTD